MGYHLSAISLGRSPKPNESCLQNVSIISAHCFCTTRWWVIRRGILFIQDSMAQAGVLLLMRKQPMAGWSVLDHLGPSGLSECLLSSLGGSAC